jgi:hypothetical protein
LNYSAGSLNGGTWAAVNGSINFGTSTITTNNANILLSGTGANFAAMAPLQVNLGRFTITNGSNFSSVGSLTNSGTITIGQESVLLVRNQLNNSAGLIDMNNRLIVDYSGSSPLDQIVGQIGTHIISALVQLDPNLAIGSMDDEDVVRLQLVEKGDTNFDALVNYIDLSTLSQHYSDGLVPQRWVDGDSNYDGIVNLTDLYALGYNYHDPQHPFTESLEVLGLPIIEIPEPVSLALCLLSAAWSLQRPRSRRSATSASRLR